MSKKDQLHRAKLLLHEALSLLSQSLPAKPSAQEVRSHVKAALVRLETFAAHEQRRQSAVRNEYDNWWKNVVSGTSHLASGNHTLSTQQKLLSQINSMISQEQNVLDELEKKSQQPDNGNSGDDLLID